MACLRSGMEVGVKKVLLVDDEPFILQGLQVLIDWQNYGFEIAGTASNGQEAVAFLKQTKVDLILADIQMPVMTGLELLEKIEKEQLSDAYPVILSGYNDFEFARKALRHSCVDYMLKPVQREELISLLERIRRMHTEREARKEETTLQEKAYFERNLIALLYGKFDESNLDYVKRHLRLSDYIRYVVVELDSRAKECREFQGEEKREYQRKLYEICREYLGEWEHHCVFDVGRREDSYDVGFVYCDYLSKETGRQEQEYLDGLLESIRCRLQVPVVMMIGNKVEEISRIGESFRSAAIARSFQDFRLEAGTNGELGNGGSGLCKESMDALLTAICQNSRIEISRLMGQVYDELNGIRMDGDIVNINISYLLFRLVHLALEQDQNVNQEEILHYISTAVFGENKMLASRAHLVKFAGEYAEYLAQLRGKSARGILVSVEEEIRKNFAGNLTLKELGKKYYINSAYLGQIFRKQYDMSFKDYLNQYRIGKAADLLLHTDLKIYEVAEQTGYRDLDYFISRFIAEKGCTPARFRRQFRE